jgi:hypothetical protein
VIYESRGFQQGLTNIIAYVLKPNGVTAGPYALAEGAVPFAGVYMFTYLSQYVDPQGEYAVVIYSPSEGIRVHYRMSLYKPPPGSDVMNGYLSDGPIVARVSSGAPLAGRVVDEEQNGLVQTARIDGEIHSNELGELTADVLDRAVEGEIDDLP